MNFVIGLILLFLLLGAIKQFARMDARAVARAVRNGGGFLGLLAAALLLLRGRVGMAAALAGMAASFAGWRTFGPAWTSFRTAAGGAGAKPGRVTTARSAMIEMRLDHDTGVMSGAVRAGAHAGRAIETLSRPELLALRDELSRDDPDGAKLLEAYLDRRFAGWREADEGEREPRRRSAAGMTSREALEVLGLQEGASAAEITLAHRALMKKLHPDHGGSTASAARVNQAKDVLMQRQG
jgi:DnaJ domain